MIWEFILGKAGCLFFPPAITRDRKTMVFLCRWVGTLTFNDTARPFLRITPERTVMPLQILGCATPHAARPEPRQEDAWPPSAAGHHFTAWKLPANRDTRRREAEAVPGARFVRSDGSPQHTPLPPGPLRKGPSFRPGFPHGLYTAQGGGDPEGAWASPSPGARLAQANAGQERPFPGPQSAPAAIPTHRSRPSATSPPGHFGPLRGAVDA